MGRRGRKEGIVTSLENMMRHDGLVNDENGRRSRKGIVERFLIRRDLEALCCVAKLSHAYLKISIRFLSARGRYWQEFSFINSLGNVAFACHKALGVRAKNRFSDAFKYFGRRISFKAYGSHMV